MDIQAYVGQYECQRFMAIAHQVSAGLELVLRDGILPPCYREVFRSAVVLCEDIVESRYYALSNRDNPYCAKFVEMSGATFWFMSITKDHPETYETIATYDDVLEICATLDALAKEEVSPRAYSDERITEVQKFFSSLWSAAISECSKEGLPTEVDFSAFPEVSMNYQ